jgi:hypothetical protein
LDGPIQTAIGRLSVLSIAVALFVGAIWSWRTAPWYLLQDQYFITVSPDNSYLQRRGAVFNIQSNYDRDLLVSGPESIPFGVNPNTNLRLLDRGLDTSSRVDDIVARRYGENCGFPLDQNPKQRILWRDTRLCNTVQLDGELLKAAVQVFQNKADAEIAQYYTNLTKNAVDKVGKSLLVALGLVVFVAAGMWVIRGNLS